MLFTRSPEAERKQVGLRRGARLRLHVALQRHALGLMGQVAPASSIFVASDDGRLAREAGVGFIPQRGAGFEARLLGALSEVASRGFSRLVLVGGDTPGLALDDLRRAWEAPGTQAVVGPSLDGGFYLLSFRAEALEALRGLPWHQRGQLPVLSARLGAMGLAMGWLPARRDLDTPRDLRLSRAVLARLMRQLLQDGAQRWQLAVAWALPWRLDPWEAASALFLPRPPPVPA